MDNEIFQGIPSLDDTAGLENYLNNSALQSAGLGTTQQNPTPEPQAQTQAQAQEIPAPEPQGQQTFYTAEQVRQLISQMSANQQQQPVQQTPVPQVSQQQPVQSPYTPQQAQLIKQLIDKGVSLDRISAALNGNRQNANNELAQRLNNLENYFQQKEYQAAQEAFVDKMTAFGDKFGLSENELVTFGNKALAMGINLTQVNDVEAVFRAVYPEQYAIRSQRLAGASNSQIYGGANGYETPRAVSSKLEDAYVEQYLKRTMPNQYVEPQHK